MVSSFARVKRWLLHENEDSRRALRVAQPRIVVHYWDGSAPGGREVRDMNEFGAFICTTERWYPGTIVRILLQGQRMTVEADGPRRPSASICVASRVIRHEDDGIAVEFVYRNKKERQEFRDFMARVSEEADDTAPGKPAHSSQRSGQALVEFALIIPLVLVLAVNAVNFGGFLFAWITVAAAARDGADYMIMSSASPGSPTPATNAEVTALVTADVASLLNKSSVAVATCTNATSASNSCTTLSDPEAPNYTLAAVDVTYTYNPFIPLFSFPKWGISATLPSGTIHRKVVMRMMQ